MTTKYPVRYLTKERADTLGINLESYPNAGPYPNVTGMRKLFWGEDAYLVRQGAYVYKVPAWIYFSAFGRG